MATYGKIGEFKESEESWTQYVERLEQYFLANEVEDVAKRRAILLGVCGSKTYALARDLLQPAKPSVTTFKKIVDTLEKHFSPKPSETVERYKFHSRNRSEDEGVAAYVAELRKLTEHCNFGETLSEMLRDRLVCGINDKKIQRRLLAERELTLKKAEEIALGEELAAKHVVDIQSETTPSSVNRVDARDKNGIKDTKDHRPDSECYRCGEKHEASACRFKDAQCFKCGRRGHIAKVCHGDKNKKKNGIQPVMAKVDAIKNAPEPKDVSQLRAFLGMLNYYHRFLPDVATILEPLHQLLGKGSTWQWGKEQQEAFATSNELLQSAELLVHFDSAKELVLVTDASDYGVGAVLSHKMEGGTERPIGHMSRSLNGAEKNYSTLEKEALAIIFGVKKFHQFLYGHSFTIKTDHKPLEGLFNEKKGIPALAAPLIQRWALTLSAYELQDIVQGWSDQW